MNIGELVGAGRTADVFALDDGRVLRRYRDGSDASGEVAVMAHLAAHGYPVPAVWPGTEPGDLVMERLSGTTMLEALGRGEITPEDAGAMLAELLRRLRTVPARHAADPSHRILHLDLHPDNVVLTPQGPIVIDWATAAEGPPGLDAAMAALILAQAALTIPAARERAPVILAAMLERLDAVAAEDLAVARARRAANPMLSAEEIGVLDEALDLITR
ncbi:phosphotransferase [Kitasatospora sp. NPDC054939]